MKLSQYAKLKGVHYKTVHRWWKAGKLDAYQLETGTVIVRDTITNPKAIALYARVSSSDQKADLERQLERLQTYALAKGYQIEKQLTEIASGLNDNRPKLMRLLLDPNTGVIVVEHK